jgi:hypothetical protein
MTSIDSMSCGLIASSALVFCPKTVKFPCPRSLTRTPST